jgi:hypothetical protein
MSTNTLDKDILATLTDEEREALEDASDDEIAALNKPGDDAAADAADASDKDDDDAEDDAPADPAMADAEPAAAAAAPAAVVADAPAPAAPVADAPKPAAPVAAQPVYTFALPDDFQAQVDGLKSKESGLWEKFDIGEMSREELQAALGALTEDRQRLQNIQLKAELAADMQRQQSEQTRDQAVRALFDRAAKPEAGGIDYRTDKAKLGQLDVFLKALAADEANEEKPLQWFLDEAHKRVQVLNGIAPTPTPAPVDAAKAKADALAKRRADPAGLEATLAHVPGGQGAGDVGGEFDDLLALEGVAFEDALNDLAKRNPQRFAQFQASTQL